VFLQYKVFYWVTWDHGLKSLQKYSLFENVGKWIGIHRDYESNGEIKIKTFRGSWNDKVKHKRKTKLIRIEKMRVKDKRETAGLVLLRRIPVTERHVLHGKYIYVSWFVLVYTTSFVTKLPIPFLLSSTS
jgi:hypothetical protein